MRNPEGTVMIAVILCHLPISKFFVVESLQGKSQQRNYVPSTFALCWTFMPSIAPSPQAATTYCWAEGREGRRKNGTGSKEGVGRKERERRWEERKMFTASFHRETQCRSQQEFRSCFCPKLSFYPPVPILFLCLGNNWNDDWMVTGCLVLLKIKELSY